MTKYAQPILFFCCYTCKDYELKTTRASPNAARPKSPRLKKAKKQGQRKGKKPSPEAPPA
jgi:hypothetical protein